MKRLIFMLILITGCSYRSRDRVIGPNDVAAGRTKITNFMSAPLRPGSPSELTPGSISRDALTDEVSIKSLKSGEVCFTIVTRTHVDMDVPLSEYNVLVNGKRRSVDNEKVAYTDFQYTGERTTVDASFVSAEAFAGLRITQPEERIFRVIERHGEVCGPTKEESEIVLDLEIPQDDLRGSWGEKFVWQVEG